MSKVFQKEYQQVVVQLVLIAPAALSSPPLAALLILIQSPPQSSVECEPVRCEVDPVLAPIVPVTAMIKQIEWQHVPELLLPTRDLHQDHHQAHQQPQGVDGNPLRRHLRLQLT